MGNYEMKFTVAEAAKLFKVENKVIKDWANKFSSYLTLSATPIKGAKRIFQLEDIRVMAYIYTYWEDNPDIENIKMGLNSNGHYENELIDNLLVEITPFFIELPENIDETWKHGVLFSGLAQFGDTFLLANSYKLAGDRLIDIALENEEARELFCPAVYNYRHATELYIKAITGHYKQSHNLINLFDRFQKLLKAEYNSQVPAWFNNIIAAFNDLDPSGTTFRYGRNSDRDEIFIDFIQLKTLMGWMAISFQNIRKHQGMPDVYL